MPKHSADSLESWRSIAERVQLKERAFWKAVHEHGLPAYKLNARVWRFKWSEVEQWLANRRTGE